MSEREKTPELYGYIKGSIEEFLQTGGAEWIYLPLVREIQRPDGEIRFIQSVTYPIKTKSRTIIGTITRDITEQKKTEEQLKYEQNLLNRVLNSIPVAVSVAEAPSWKLIRVNDQFEKIWGQKFIPSNNIDKYSKYTGYHHDGRHYKAEEWPLARTISNGEFVEGEEIKVIFEDGNEKVLSVSSTPIKNENNEIILGVVIAADISRYKKAEEDLRQSEATFRAFFELAAVGTAMLDPSTGYFLEVNDQFSNITGYSP